MTGFVADIHGNLPALEAALALLDARGCGEIYSLGDVAGYGPFPDACMILLRARGIPHILGNHDAYLLGRLGCTRSTAVNRVIEWQRERVSAENLRWLGSCADRIETDVLWAVHGGPRDALDEYVADFSFPRDDGRALFLTAHTHIQSQKKEGARIWCNPGSVGQPRDGDPRAACALWSEGGVELLRAEYDIDAVTAAMRAAGFEPRLYENLYRGLPIGAPEHGIGRDHHCRQN